MKLRTAGIFSVGLFFIFSITVISFNTGCGTTPASPAATPTPAPPPNQLIWKNGTMGTWFGQSEGISGGGYSSVAITDNITGDTSSLAVTSWQGNSYGGWDQFNVAVAQDASSYYSSGHLQFDIELSSGFNNCGASTINVGYGNNSTISTYAINFSTMSTTQFSHISIPFNLFSSNLTSSVTVPFYVTVCGSGGSPALYFNDIKWTGN